MISRVATVCAFSCSLLAYTIGAQSAEVAAVVGEFDEHFSQEVPVSGNVVAGLMFKPDENTAGSDFKPYVQLPKAEKNIDMFCLSVVSQDGVYSSRNSYRVPEVGESNVLFADYSQTKHSEILNNHKIPVALKVQPGQCGDTAPNTYLPSGTGDSAASSGLLLMIDSLGATDVLVAARGQDRRIVRGKCKSLEGERKTGFDFKCDLPIAANGDGAIEIKIQRTRFGRKMPPVSISVDG